MKKIFTFLLSACVCTMVMAQRPTGTIVKATVVPKIDGVIDDVWKTAHQYDVDKNFKTELPTFGAKGTTYWKALWDDKGMYILIVANDDHWSPNWTKANFAANTNDYQFDMCELYFDTNYTLEDGKGGQGTNGNRQIAPNPTNGKVDGTQVLTTINGVDVISAYKVTEPAWTIEYSIPWEAIPDKDGILFDKTGTMGFDVDLTDRDPGDADRKRALWANVGAKDENWNNMDDAGRITFEGAEAPTFVDVINIANGSITKDNGTLQLTPEILPTDASNKKLKWTLTNGTGIAKIDANGLVTGITNGTVTVRAAATDGGWTESNEATITISGQVVDKNDIWNSLNKITNWNFDGGKTGDFPTGWSGWIDTGAAGCANMKPVSVDGGVASMQVGIGPNGEGWHYQLNQGNLTCEANVPYTVKFKTWASKDATPCNVDFESTGSSDLYARYGTSTDGEALNGGSDWKYTVSTKAAWFTFHVVFDKMIPTTGQKIQWMNAFSDNIVYIDSVLIIKDDDLKLLSTGVKPLAENTALKVYPNPVGNGNLITVEMAVANKRVAIYNAVGQLMIEKMATGTIARFDVGTLPKGIYFIKLDDGTSQKFIR